jgi:hypothetical protein
MTSDVGKGPGLTGSGSQTAGGDGISSDGTAAPGSGSSTGGAGATSSAAANPTLIAPFDFKAVYVSMVVLGCFLGGGLLL